MRNRHRLFLVSAGLALAVTGCDRAWREFQRVELGKPLPPRSLFKTGRQRQCGGDQGAVANIHSWSDSGLSPFPPSLGMHVLTSGIDADGLVIAKSYHGYVWSNYLLFTAAAVRAVVEVQAPPEMVRDWTGLRRHLVDSMAYLDPKALDSYELPLFLQLVTGANFLTGSSAVGGLDGLKQSIDYLPLKGIERKGYDRTFQPVAGGTVRLRNLGQSRIRIDLNLLRLYDPLALAAYQY